MGVAKLEDGTQHGARRSALAVEWLKQRTRRFDRDADGSLNLAEFMKWWPDSDKTRIKQIFDMVDNEVKANDELSVAELDSVFKREDGMWPFVLKDRLALVEQLLAMKEIKQNDAEGFL